MRAALMISAVLFGMAYGASSAAAASCRDPAGFDAWLGKIKQEAIAQGISQDAIDEGLDGVTFDQNVIRHDHGQGVFRQSFEQFSQRMVPPRIARAKSLERKYAPVFARIEQRFGVPAAPLLAIWGLETDFGAVSGNFATIRSIATLAYDCRRSDMFRAELFDALRMIQRGASPDMHGAWAGEIGQTQFMPSTFVKYAVDFDGSGRPDLNHSVPDVLASTANFLQGHGWKRGADWAPGQPNFAAIQEWNKSSVYSRTIAYFATRLAGTDTSAYDGGGDEAAPAPHHRAQPSEDLDSNQMGGDDDQAPHHQDPLDEQ